MSKDSSSRQLLGTIKFDFDPTKTRTLNATQAYDSSTSQIVLGSFLATAIKKLLTKDLGGGGDPYPVPMTGTVAVTLNSGGTIDPVVSLLRKADQKAEPAAITGPASATLNFAPQAITVSGLKKNKNESRFFEQADTAGFVGTSAYAGTVLNMGVLGDASNTKSNKTKDIFYGNIIVGTGLYRTWQNKYAVLKVDLLTNKAILRVYNE